LGTPSLLTSQRRLQRVHASHGPAGIDGAGALFADPARTARFARSHGLTALAPGGEAEVVVHAFAGEVGLVELRRAGRVRHLTEGGEDLGDVRPGATYDPAIEVPATLEEICAWSRTLSAHVPRPYVQLQWRTTPALVGIDVAPERVPLLERGWDERLGVAFEHAQARVLLQPLRLGGLANRVPGGVLSPEADR